MAFILLIHASDRKREVIAIARREKAREVEELLLELGFEYFSRSVLEKGKEDGIGFSHG